MSRAVARRRDELTSVQTKPASTSCTFFNLGLSFPRHICRSSLDSSWAATCEKRDRRVDSVLRSASDCGAREGAVKLRGKKSVAALAHPVLRRLEISPALSTPDETQIARYALGDVDLSADAANAHVGRIRWHLHTAQTAEPAGEKEKD